LLTAEEIDDLLLLAEDAPEELTPEQREYVARLLASISPLFEGEDDPAVWTKRYYPKTFTRPFTKYQKEFWAWGFAVSTEEENRPRVECEPRGVGKSTGAETLIVRWLAKRVMNYVLYVSATDDQSGKHLKAIKRKLENEKLLADYSHLKPRIEKYRNALSNWSGERLVTDGGQVVECVSLLGNMRGFKTEEDSRIDAIVLDDIDSSKDSPHVVQKKLRILSDEILPAGDDHTIVLFAQNLIHRDSIAARVMDHRADILSRRHFAGPFPLMKWYDAEKTEHEDGSREWKITAGEPFDPAIDTAYCESLLNQYGRAAFDRECQHDVFRVAEDKDFREWDEIYHITTWGELARTYAEFRVEVQDAGGYFLPARWNVGLGFDWGATRQHPSAIIYVARPDEATPFDESHFVVGETVRPAFPFDPHLAAEVVSPGRVAQAVRRKLADLRVTSDSRITEALMSHEASAARNTLMEDLPEELQLFFSKWKAAKGSGVAQIQNLLEIDYRKPHPFRRYPEGHECAGQPLMGRPRIFFIVADLQGELYMDGDEKLRVRGAKDEAGLARLRFEMPLYSQYHTGQEKIDDDAVDGLRGLMASFGVDSERMTAEARRIHRLQEHLKPDAVLAQKGTRAFPELISAASHEMHRLKRQDEREAEKYSADWRRATGRPVRHQRYGS
jgi:hypothetical protein